MITGARRPNKLDMASYQGRRVHQSRSWATKLLKLGDCGAVADSRLVDVWGSHEQNTKAESRAACKVRC